MPCLTGGEPLIIGDTGKRRGKKEGKTSAIRVPTVQKKKSFRAKTEMTLKKYLRLRDWKHYKGAPAKGEDSEGDAS